MPDWINRYGLPDGRARVGLGRRGPRPASRVPVLESGRALGETRANVTIVLAGDLAKEVGLVPAAAQVPEPIPFG